MKCKCIKCRKEFNPIIEFYSHASTGEGREGIKQLVGEEALTKLWNVCVEELIQVTKQFCKDWIAGEEQKPLLLIPVG